MTVTEVERIRDKTPIGARVTYVKKQSIDAGVPILGRGRIESKYRDVFTVRTTDGMLRAFQWKDLLLEISRPVTLGR